MSQNRNDERLDPRPDRAEVGLVGLVFREAERKGVIIARDDFSDLIRATGCSAEEIDECLSALVDAEGRVLGVSMQPAEVGPVSRERLLRAGLISQGLDGQLEITGKGQLMLGLLRVYGDPLRIWIRT